jgi:hypothetical protein
MLDRLRRAGAVPAALLVAVTLFFLWWVDRFFPLRQWLFFLYLRVWAYAAVFTLASLVAGLRLVTSLFPEPPRLGERLLFGFAVGVLAFFWGVFLAGVLGLYGPVFFFVWPAVLLAFGAAPAWREARRLRRHLRRFGMRLVTPRGLVESAAIALLLVGCLAVYLQVLTPVNVGADAVWYHLPVAEHYVAAGKIRPFAEGWYNGTLPQLASVLYTWAFQAPGDLFFHIALAAHLEFVLFLATLAGVGALVRRLAATRLPYAGALMFLFPGFLIYDSNLIIGADHILAFWAPPLALALLRLGRRFEPREGVMAGLILAGALLTKYQALYFLAPAALWVSVLAVRTRRLRPFIAWGLAVALAWSAHWLKNWIFYGDPLYPMLRAWLPSHPFPPGAAELMNEVLTPPMFRFTGTAGTKILDTLQVLFAFAFVPHDWDFHGPRPVFGALFTCLLVALPFSRARPRLWGLVIAIHLGIVLWFATAHEDRYLQALLPWMAAAAAALLVLVARRGYLARAAVIALVAVQAIYGSDVYLYRVHAMIGDSPLKAFVDYVSLGQAGRFKDRARVWGDLQDNDLSARVPKGSKLLAHHFTEKLGAGIPSVLDGKGWQAAIDYLALPTPAATLALWRSLGVTHAWWNPGLYPLSPDMVGREAVFQRAVTTYIPTTGAAGKYRFGALDLRTPRPDADVPTRLAWLGCGGDPMTGIYTPRELADGRAPTDPGLPTANRGAAAALGAVNVVVLHPSCGAPPAEVSAVINAEFVPTTHMGDLVLWVRRPAR